MNMYKRTILFTKVLTNRFMGFATTSNNANIFSFSTIELDLKCVVEHEA